MKTITLDIDDRLLERLSAIATSQNRTIQELLTQLLISLDSKENAEAATPLDDADYDPITPLIGSLHLDTHDLAENHDLYLGQALYQEIKGGE